MRDGGGPKQSVDNTHGRVLSTLGHGQVAGDERADKFERKFIGVSAQLARDVFVDNRYVQKGPKGRKDYTACLGL